MKKSFWAALIVAIGMAAIAPSLFAADTYLPSVYSAIPTPTTVPTAVPTVAAPRLEDGEYRANTGGDGYIRFRVTDGGTKASSADVMTDIGGSVCSPRYHAFSNASAITDGRFRFAVVVDHTSVSDSLTCTATSSTSATCSARITYSYEQGFSAACGHGEGVATLRD